MYEIETLILVFLNYNVQGIYKQSLFIFLSIVVRPDDKIPTTAIIAPGSNVSLIISFSEGHIKKYTVNNSRMTK